MSGNIKHIIQQLAGNGNETTALVCTVTAVNTTARTIDCQPLDESAPLLGVNLQANQESSLGICLFPKVGSYVMVGFANNGQSALLLLADEIDRLSISIGSTTIEADQNGITFNGGNLGGLVKVETLTQKINNIETDINNLKNILAAWIPEPQDGGAALKGAATSWATQPLTPTQQSEIENSKIKQ